MHIISTTKDIVHQQQILIVLEKFGAVIVLESSGDLGYLCKVNYKSSEKST
jgi:hypothetical protein